MNFSKNINNQLKIDVIKDEDSLISHKYLTILNPFSHKIIIKKSNITQIKGNSN